GDRHASEAEQHGRVPRQPAPERAAGCPARGAGRPGRVVVRRVFTGRAGLAGPVRTRLPVVHPRTVDGRHRTVDPEAGGVALAASPPSVSSPWGEPVPVDPPSPSPSGLVATAGPSPEPPPPETTSERLTPVSTAV